MGDRDAELARLAGQGDMAALEALYRRSVEKVWRYARLRTNSRDAAADIVQETFLRVTRSISQFKGKSTFGTWLFTVARAVTVEHIRRECRERRGLSNPAVLRLVPPGADAPDSTVRDETRDAVRQALTKLSGAQRDAIVLCELSEFGIREACAVLGWSESRVKVTLFRARRRLRELLGCYVSEPRECSGQDRST